MSNPELREEVLNLMKEKDRIESEIRELTSVLEKQGIGMTEPLVDADDFPLNSIDIYKVREVRHRIICLQNDHKAIMKRIENGLTSYYNPENRSTSSSVDEPMDTASHSLQHTEPFAKVNLVTAGSPADYANLKVNDLILEFGSVNKDNFRNMMDIANVVQHSEGQKLKLRLKRGDKLLNTVLLPKTWRGQGLLGCSIVSL